MLSKHTVNKYTIKVNVLTIFLINVVHYLEKIGKKSYSDNREGTGYATDA